MKSILSGRAALRWGGAVLTAGIALGFAATTANASSGPVYSEGGYTVYEGTQAKWITAEYDGMNVAVPGGSGAVGTRIIQWYNNGGAEQKWYFDAVYDSSSGFEGYLIRNENSGLCLSTDGVAGDRMTQEPCNPQLLPEWFDIVSSGTDNQFYNRQTGLYMDVSGFSYAAGANIDLWYSNGGDNQWFWITDTSS